MTGITKDELMQMAREVGVSTSCWQIWPPTLKRQIDFTPEQLASFTDAILERAAEELEKGKLATVLGAGTEWGDGWKCGTTDALDGAQDAIRALKINTGD